MLKKIPTFVSCWADMQKYNFFTQTWFEPKIFYQKKCVNYNKSNSRQNSVKGPKDPNNAKKCQTVTVPKCAKNATKKRKMAPLLTFPRYSVKFYKDFTPDRIFLHQHCWHIGTFLHLCCWAYLGTMLFQLPRRAFFLAYLKIFGVEIFLKQ